MALSSKSQTYNDIKSTLSGIKAEKGSITKEDLSNVARSFEIDVADITGAAQEEKSLLAEAKEYGDMFNLAPDDPRRKDLENYIAGDPYSGGSPGRMFRRALGETVEAVGMLGEAFIPDKVGKSELLEKTSKAYNYIIPESMQRDMQGYLDPYHGEGLLAGLEELGGTMASYAMPTSLASKGLNTIARSTPFIRNAYTRLGSRGKKFAQAGKYGVAYTTGATLMQDPRENEFDMVRAYIFEDPEAMKRLQQLAENPKDIEAKDYLDAFIRNLAIEGLFGAGVHSAGSMASALARSYRQGSLSSVRNVVTQIGDTTRGAARPYVYKLADITEKPRRRVGQYLGSRMGTDDNFIASLFKREGADKVAILRADAFAQDLQKSIDDTLPEQYKTQEFYEDVINKALTGDEDRLTVLRGIAPDVADNVRLMRNELDTLSARLPIGAGNLKATIDSNLGVYINTSYQIFDNPAYKKELSKKILSRPNNIQRVRLINERVRTGEITRQEGDDLINNITDDVVENAADYIARQLGVDKTNPIVQENLEKLAKTEDTNTFSSFMESLAGKNKYTSSSKPLMSKKDIDVSIRDLLGEVKDPKENFKNTYVKLSTMNAQYEFLEDIAGQLSIQFQNKVRRLREANPQMTQDEAIAQVQKTMVDLSSDVGADKKLNWVFQGAEKGDVVNPLQGVYADKAYADAIKNGFDVNLDSIKPVLLKNIFRYGATIKGSTQYAKTVLNVGTHGKNMMGNVVFLTANGILPKGETIQTAAKTIAGQLRNKNSKELADQIAEYIELGVTNSGVGLGIVRRNLNEAFRNPDSYISRITQGSKVKEAGKKLTEIYQAEDDFFKIIHFERTKDYLKKVYPNMADDAIKKMAAQRTRDLMPNYQLVPKIFKMSGYSPFGDFVSFAEESIRTSKNLVKYTLKDAYNAGFKASDENFNAAALRQAAATRLAGMTVAGSLGTIAHNLTMSAFGITKEQDNAMNLLGPGYNVNQDKLYYGPIQRDKRTGHIVAPNVSLGAYDPYNIVKVGARFLHERFLDGDPKSDFELNKLWTGTLEQTLYPIVGPSMITETLRDMYTGKQDFDSPEKGFVARALKNIVDLYDPSYIRWYNRRKDYENSGMSDNLYTISEGDVDIPALLGFRRNVNDISVGIGYNLFKPINEINKADRTLKNVLNNPNATSEDILSEYKNAQKKRLEGFKNLRGVLQLYKDMGFSIEGLTQEVTLGGKKRSLQPSELELIYAADQNNFIPSELKPRETFQGPLADVPTDQINNIYQQLFNSRIDPND